MESNRCQIHSLNDMAEPMGGLELLWQKRNRFLRILKRRRNYLINFFSGLSGDDAKARAAGLKKSTAVAWPAGTRVRVKSKEEIQKTLNDWNQLKGCSFMEEMWPFCGTEQKVLRRIGKFLDERDYLIKKCKGIVILDGVFCEGTKDFGACDRTCFFFWRDEWLEGLD